MPYNDTLATLQARIRADLPQVAVGGSSVVFNALQAFVSAKTDTDFGIGQSSINMFLSTASGTGLDIKADDYNALRSKGLTATVNVVFSIPQAAASLITIPTEMTVSTPGDPANPAVAFVTKSGTTIAIGDTTSGSVLAAAQLPGITGNVAAHTITVVVTQIGSSVLMVDNAADAMGGADSGGDNTLRAAAKANISPKYGVQAITDAIIAAGAYDAYVYDPLDGSRTIVYYYADAAGAQSPSLTASVATAVLNVLPAGLTATPAAFSVVNFTGANVSYSAPTQVQSVTLNPILQNAVATYIQGLKHGEAPTSFRSTQVVNGAAGLVLTDFAITNLNGAPLNSYTPNNTILYRMNGNPLSVVTVTRV